MMYKSKILLKVTLTLKKLDLNIGLLVLHYSLSISSFQEQDQYKNNFEITVRLLSFLNVAMFIKFYEFVTSF